MSKSIVSRILAALFALMGVGLIIVGAIGIGQRQEARTEEVLSTLRTRTLLAATGEGAVESFVSAAKQEATAKVKAEGGDMAAIREASAKAEENARANASNSLIDYATVDAKPVEQAAQELRKAMMDYTAEEKRAQDAYIEEHQQELIQAEPEVEVVPDEAAAPVAAEDGEVASLEDVMPIAEPQQVFDLSGFMATPEMERLQGMIDEKYLALGEALKGPYPVLDNAALTQLKPIILPVVHQKGDVFDTEFDRYVQAGALPALGGGATGARMMRYGIDLITVAVALLLLALMSLFYTSIVSALGVPRFIIGSFFLLLCVVSMLYDLSITTLLSNTIVRTGMNSVMVLAMVPAIQCGISLNLGLPLGIVGGLLGGLMCIEFGFSGWAGFAFAMAVGLVISGVLGYLYGHLLNRLKGSEMAVTTYVGFSIVSLMCIAWLVLPFRSLALRWPLGNGLRQTSSLAPAFQYILDRTWAFSIGGIRVPTGLLLFMGICCLLVYLFSRSKTGIAMSAVGNNPRFAEATGINVNRMRIIGTTISTMLGAVGILVYSQSFGYLQLYTHPRTLGLVAASAILIGGASTSKARISHVLIGTFLFQGVLTLGMPVANALVPGSTIAETMRILVSNGIILYALTKSGGDSRG